jgi:ribosomal protein S18 acetylase RimI-like enzyme
LIRRIQSPDAEPVAEFLDRFTLANRWMVAFFRHFSELPRDAVPYWGLWLEEGEAGAGGGPDILAVAAHNFSSGISYVAGVGEFNAGELEAVIEEDLLPERLVGDVSFLERWRGRSTRIFSRVEGKEELVILALPPGELDRSGLPERGFRRAVKADRPRLAELERLYARERGQEEPLSDLASLIERGLIFVYEEGEQVVGVVRSNLSDGRYVHLGGLYVHPAHRRAGIGARLLAGLCDEIHRSGAVALLDTDQANEAALAVYRSVGFREVGRGLVLRFGEDAWRGGG